MTIVIDTGVFFAYYSLRDKHHLDLVAFIVHLAKNKWSRAYIINHILDETLDILRYKIPLKTSRAFLEAFIENNVVKVIFTDEELEYSALKFFKKNAFKED